MPRTVARRFPRPLLLALPLFSACGAPASEEGARWSMLVDGSWTLAPGTEQTRWCKKVVLTEDIYVSAIRPVHPPGTHHTTLNLGPDDGEASCEGTALGPSLVYAAGVGSGELRLPAGVAMKLPAGQALYLGLHIYNVGTKAPDGTSGLEILRAAPEEVQHEADLLLAGPLSFSLPAQQRSTITDECKIRGEQTAFALFPHMHQRGRHLKTTATVGGASMVLHDAAYSFEEQVQYPLAPLALRPGDTIKTECTYENDSPAPVRSGESTDTEMCFSILFRYPASPDRFCTGASGGIPGNCAKAGDPGNDQGVGRHCTMGGGECAGASAALCLSDFAMGAYGNFCTKVCGEDKDCGADATCVGSGARKACMPASCLGGGGS